MKNEKREKKRLMPAGAALVRQDPEDVGRLELTIRGAGVLKVLRRDKDAPLQSTLDRVVKNVLGKGKKSKKRKGAVALPTEETHVVELTDARGRVVSALETTNEQAFLVHGKWLLVSFFRKKDGWMDWIEFPKRKRFDLKTPASTPKR